MAVASIAMVNPTVSGSRRATTAGAQIHGKMSGMLDRRSVTVLLFINKPNEAGAPARITPGSEPRTPMIVLTAQPCIPIDRAPDPIGNPSTYTNRAFHRIETRNFWFAQFDGPS